MMRCNYFQIINEEDGGLHKRYASPSLRERGVQLTHAPSRTTITSVTGYGTSSIVAMDKSATVSTGTSLSSASFLSQSKTLGKNTERTLETVLHSSKQKVSAIESLLKGVSLLGKQNFSSARSTSLDLGILEMLNQIFHCIEFPYSLNKIIDCLLTVNYL